MHHSAAITGTLLLVFALSVAAGYAESPAAGPRASTKPAVADISVARRSIRVARHSIGVARRSIPVAVDTAGADLALNVASAVAALSAHVTRSSSDDALATAFRAYYRYRAAHPEQVRKPYLYYVDYGLSNTTPRGYVFDMQSLVVVDGPFTVAHGRGSSRGRNGVPTMFSNRPGSGATSLGLYVTQETYAFAGHAGGRLYHSIGLRLMGVSGDFNDAARRRGVVAHGAPYVTARDAGRSEGCPAIEQQRARRLLPLLADGSLVFLYSPRDSVWLEQGPWL